MTYLPPSQSTAIYDPLTDQSRVGLLAQKRDEKIATLGRKSGNNNTIKDFYNDWNTAEWQYIFNRAIEEEQLNGDGTAYANNADNSYYGPVGIFYGHGTNRVGQPEDPRFRDIKPGYASGFWNSSQARQKYFDRGPEGVNVDDVIFNYKFPEITARTLEAISRGNATALSQRVNKEYSQDAKDRFGSGYTEILARREDGTGLYGDAALFPAITKERGDELFAQFKNYKEQMFKSAYPEYKGSLEDFNNGNLPVVSPEETQSTSNNAFDNLKLAMLNRESSGNYRAVNRLGYAGGYQFGAQALEGIGYLKKGSYSKKVGNRPLNDPNAWTGKDGINSLEDFLNSPEVQDSAFEQLADSNLKTLRNLGTITDNSTPQEIAGYIAASHLLGAGAASRSLEGTDANNTKGTTYFNIGSNAVLGDIYGVDKASTSNSSSIFTETPATREEKIAAYKDMVQRREAEEATLFDRVLDVPKTAARTFVKEVAIDLADWVGEGLNKVTDGVVGWDIGDEKYKTNLANEMFGINPYAAEKEYKRANELATKIVDDYRDDGKEIDYADAFELFKLGITTPELFADSVGFLGSFFVPFLGWGGKAAKADKTIRGINKAVDAGLMTKDAAKIAVATAKKDVSIINKVRGFAQNNAGLMQVSAGNVNDQIDAYKEEHGEAPSVGKVTQMFVTESLLLGLDRWADLSILKSPAALKGARDAFSSVTKEGKAKILAKTLGVAGGLSVNIGKEAAQEYVQEIGQEFNVQFNFDDNGSFESVVNEAGEVLLDRDMQIAGVTGAGLGAGGAVQFAGVGALGKTFKKASSAAVDKTKEVVAKKEVEPEEEFIVEDTSAKKGYDTSLTYRFNNSVMNENTEEAEALADEVKSGVTEGSYAETLKTDSGSIDIANDIAYTLGQVEGNAELETLIEQTVEALDMSKEEVESALTVSFEEGKLLAAIQEADTVTGNALRLADNLARRGKLSSNTKLVNHLRKTALETEDPAIIGLTSKIFGKKITSTKKEEKTTPKNMEELSEQAYEVSKTKEEVNELIDEVESKNYVLGSNADAVAKIIELDAADVAGSKDINRVESTITSIADKYNIDDRMLKLIRTKDAFDVETEATVGSGGYKTYGKMLRQLEAKKGSNTAVDEQAAIVRAKLESFLESQEAAIEALEKGIKDAYDKAEKMRSENRLVNGVTNFPTGFIKSNGKPFDIGISSRGFVIKNQVDKAKELIATKERNIAGIKEALGIDTTKEEKPVKEKVTKKIEPKIEPTKTKPVQKTKVDTVPETVTPIEKREVVEPTKVEKKVKTKPVVKEKAPTKKPIKDSGLVNLVSNLLDKGESDQDIINKLIIKGFTEDNAKEILRDAKIDDSVKGEKPKEIIKRIINNSPYKSKEPLAIVNGIPTLQSEVKGQRIEAIVQRNPATYIKVVKETTLNTVSKFNKEITALTEQAKASLGSVIQRFNARERSADWQAAWESVRSPARGVIFDSKGKMNDNVVLAIRAALSESLSFDKDLYSKTFKSREDVARMLGKNNENEVSDEMYELVKGRGVLLDTVGNSLGDKIASLLGIAESDTSSHIQNFARLKADLGGAAIQMAVAEGLLEFNQVPAPIFAAANDTTADKENAKVTFVNFVDEKGTIESRANEAELIKKSIPEVAKNRADVYLNGVPKEVVNKRTANYHNGKIGLTPSKTHQKALKELMETEWVFDMELAQEILDNREAFLKNAGYIDENSQEFAALSFDAREGQKGKNRKVMNDLEAIENIVKGNTSDISLWFEWYAIVSQRVMINSNTINPMNDKYAHRWIVQPKGMETSVKVARMGKGFVFTNEEGKNISKEVRYSLAQAFGMGVDKKNTKKIEALGNALLRLEIADIANMKEHLMSDGKFKFTDELTGKEFEVEVEHIGHTLQGLKFLYQVKTEKEFTTKLSAEFDAVTSGFGLKLMQMPILEKLFTHLERVGILIPSIGTKKAKSMNDLIDRKGFLDSYKNLAGKVSTKISYDDIKKTVEDIENKKEKNKVKSIIGNVGSTDKDSPSDINNRRVWNALKENLPSGDNGITNELRNLFKDPFMTFNYSRSIKKIKKGLAINIVNSIVNDLTRIDGKNLEPKHKKMLKVISEITGIPYKEVRSVLRSTELTRIKVGRNSNLKEYLGTFVELTYGKEVEIVFNDQFAPFIEAQKNVTDAFKYAHEVFDYEYKKRLDAIIKRNGRLTTKDRNDTLKTLLEVFPLIDGPLSEQFKKSFEVMYLQAEGGEVEGNFEDGSLAIFKQERKRGEGLLPADFQLEGEDKKAKGINPKVKEFASPGVSGSVLPIHSIDAAILLGTFLSEGDMMLIHDAIIPKLDQINESVATYNKQVMEVNESYSFIGSVNDLVKRVHNFVKVNPDGKRSLKVVGHKYENGKKLPISLSEMQRETVVNVQKLANNVQNGRAKLFNDFKNDPDAKIMHMAGMQEGVYSMFEETDNQIKDEINETFSDTISDMLDNLLETINKPCK